MSKEQDTQKPKPTAEDVRGPIMRLDAYHQDGSITVALNAKDGSERIIIENSQTPKPTPQEKREE